MIWLRSGNTQNNFGGEHRFFNGHLLPYLLWRCDPPYFKQKDIDMSSRFKDWYHATSDNPERHSEKSKRYYEKNREELLAKKRAKDANNKKERSEYQREYYKRVRKPRREAERAKEELA